MIEPEGLDLVRPEDHAPAVCAGQGTTALAPERLRAVVEGVLRVLDFKEWPGVDTGADLLALNNRLVGNPERTITDADITTIGNGSAVIMWLKSQLRVAKQLLADGVGGDPRPPPAPDAVPRSEAERRDSP